MTKSTITDERITSVIERLEHFASNLKWTNVRGAQDLLTAADGLRELQERRKADSEPVAWRRFQETPTDGGYWVLCGDKPNCSGVEPLYRHAQPVPSSEPITVTDDMAYAFHHALTDSMIGADDVEEIKTGLRAVFANLTAPVVSAEYPDRLPCSVLLEPGLRFGKGIKTSTMLAALARRAVHESDMAALSPEERAEFQARIEDFKSLIAQQPVVPDEKPMPNSLSMYAVDAVAAIAEVKGWNACRAAMLAAAPQSPGSEPATVPGKWIPASEQMPPSRHEVLVGRWWGEKPRWCCKWATYIPGHPDAQSSGWLIPGGSWTPTHWMELPDAPQEAINALIPLVSRNEQEVK